MISDSVDYESSILAGDRNTAQEYYYGMLPRLGGSNDAESGTTIVEDPKRDLRGDPRLRQGDGESLDLCVDRRARRDHADDAGVDPAVRGERESGVSCAASPGGGRPGAASDRLCELCFLE